MTCKLCRRDRPLVKSHIFPEWLYKPLYDDDHTFMVLSSDEKKRRGTRPKGLYERLFCGDCEQKLSKWEGYASNVFNNSELILEQYDAAIVFSNIEYSPFKLFQISLIWRAAIATREEIPELDLGPHAERMRMMLLEGNPGEVYEYGTILIFPETSQEIMQQFIYPPDKIPGRLDGHSAFRATFGGLFWLFIVSGHSKRFRYKEAFLSKDGHLPVWLSKGTDRKFMGQLASELKKAGMLDAPANPIKKS